MKAAAKDVGKWSYGSGDGGGVGAKIKAKMKNAMVEKYGEFAISLGLNNEMDTELNMSPEAKLRRQALYQKEKADEMFENFNKK